MTPLKKVVKFRANKMITMSQTFSADYEGSLWIENSFQNTATVEYKRRDGLVVKVSPKNTSEDGQILLEVFHDLWFQADKIRLQTRGGIDRVFITAVIDNEFPLQATLMTKDKFYKAKFRKLPRFFGEIPITELKDREAMQILADEIEALMSSWLMDLPFGSVNLLGDPNFQPPKNQSYAQTPRQLIKALKDGTESGRKYLETRRNLEKVEREIADGKYFSVVKR